MGTLKHVYVTAVGEGPKVLPASEALADASTGLPLSTAKVEGVDKGLE